MLNIDREVERYMYVCLQIDRNRKNKNVTHIALYPYFTVSYFRPLTNCFINNDFYLIFDDLI